MSTCDCKMTGCVECISRPLEREIAAKDAEIATLRAERDEERHARRMHNESACVTQLDEMKRRVESAERDEASAANTVKGLAAGLPMTCARCAKPAACVGEYEGHGGFEPACDECCGHANEDGICVQLRNARAESAESAESAEAARDAIARAARPLLARCQRMLSDGCECAPEGMGAHSCGLPDFRREIEDLDALLANHPGPPESCPAVEVTP